MTSDNNTTTTTDETTTTMTYTYSRPVVPPLYFEKHGMGGCSSSNSSSNTTTTTTGPSHDVPSELFGRCVEYCNWGDLAKLACVQSSWSTIVKDTADVSSQSKWELAQSLLKGHCGLQPNPSKAVTLLQELAHIPVDTTTGKPIINDDNDDNNNNDADTDTCYYAPAIRQLADCYLDGIGVKQNAECALAWLEASFVVGGDAEAAHEVALIQEFGRHGIEVDVVAAAGWFTKAANAGHVDSMAELGLCYELGCGVEQCDEQSLDWYTKAANLGHATAKFSVGEAFEEARGVPQSDQEACLWYHRALLAGDTDSKKALRRLYDIARIVVPGVGDILRE